MTNRDGIFSDTKISRNLFHLDFHISRYLLRRYSIINLYYTVSAGELCARGPCRWCGLQIYSPLTRVMMSFQKRICTICFNNALVLFKTPGERGSVSFMKFNIEPLKAQQLLHDAVSTASTSRPVICFSFQLKSPFSSRFLNFDSILEFISE